MYYCGAYKFNGTQAAIAAGYSEKTAQSISQENLTKPLISKAIQDELRKRATDHEELIRDIIAEYKKIAFSGVTDSMEFQNLIMRVKNSEEIPAHAVAAIKSVKSNDNGIQVEFYDKKGALDSLSRILGAFNDGIMQRDSDTYESLLDKLAKQDKKDEQQGVGSSKEA